MRALILGGNRFFGKGLAQRLCADGVDVTLLNRGTLDDGLGSKVERIKLDRRTLSRDLAQSHPQLKNQRWDLVYDQVCYDAFEAQNACETFDGLTRRYVFTSTQSVYALGSDISENAFDPLHYRYEKPVSRDSDYGEAKRQAEATFFQKASFAVKAVRFPIVFGEDDYTQRLKFHVDHVAQGKAIYLPQPRAKISSIYSQDAAQFLATLVNDNSPWGAVNCCSTEPLSLNLLVSLIEEKLQKIAIIKSIPGQGEESPFGVEKDWYMSNQKLLSQGFWPMATGEYIPKLIDFYLGQLQT